MCAGAPKTRYPEFIQPAVLLALAVLILNDHWLKHAGLLPGSVTGKLSDFAGLLYFPLFATAGLRWVGSLVAPLLRGGGPALQRALRLTPRKLALSCAVTGLAFSALQLSARCAELYVAGTAALGFASHVTQDITDLWALTALPLTYWLGRGRGSGRRLGPSQ